MAWWLELAKYDSRNQVFSPTSGIFPRLNTQKKFPTENEQVSPRKHEGLFWGLFFHEARIIFKGTFFYSSITDLQGCVNFCCTA